MLGKKFSIRLRFLSIVFVLLIAYVIPMYANPFTGSTLEPSIRLSAPAPALVSGQARLRSSLGDAFMALNNTGDRSVLWALLGFAFLYGVLHAAGPGHRKTVVFSFYLARKASVFEPLGIGLLLAVLHGGSSVIVMAIFRGVGGAISGKTDKVAQYLEGGSYLILAISSLVLIGFALRELFCKAGSNGKGISSRISIGALLGSGLYPCPGAILILVLAFTLDRFAAGVIAVLAMSFGMSVPIIIAGYLAWFGRTGLFIGLKKNEASLARISAGVELGGYLILFIFSLWMVYPFIVALFPG